MSVFVLFTASRVLQYIRHNNSDYQAMAALSRSTQDFHSRNSVFSFEL